MCIKHTHSHPLHSYAVIISTMSNMIILRMCAGSCFSHHSLNQKLLQRARRGNKKGQIKSIVLPSLCGSVSQHCSIYWHKSLLICVLRHICMCVFAILSRSSIPQADVVGIMGVNMHYLVYLVIFLLYRCVRF